MPELRPCGTWLHPDGEGYLVSPCAPEKLLEPWASAARAAAEGYREHLGEALHSVYVRGSVAKGDAVEGVSDVDSFAVVRTDTVEMFPAWTEALGRELDERFPFSQGVEFLCLPLGKVMAPGSYFRFLLATQALCLEGEDLTPEVGRMRLADAPRAQLPRLQRDLVRFEEDFDKEDLEGLFAWIFKRLLRGGFQLIQEEEGAWTRDLWPCRDALGRHFPDRSDDFHRALDGALNQPRDPEAARDLVRELGEFVLAEARRRGHLAP